MNKKIISIVTINILILIVMYFCLEFLMKNFSDCEINIDFLKPNYSNNINIDIEKYEIEDKPEDFKYIDNNKNIYKAFCGEERRNFGQNYKKNPIVVFGSSYAYGHGLKKEKSFPYILSEIVKRPVYNYGMCGSDVLMCLNHLQNENDFEKEKVKNADYVIYIYMWDHISRDMLIRNFMPVYKYMYPNTKLDKLLEKFYVFNYLNLKLKRKKILDEYPNIEKSIIYQKKLLLYLYEKLKNDLPNAKFIIVIYDEKISSCHEASKIKYVSDIINSNLWQELEDETYGKIKVVHTKDITGFVFDKNWKLKADIVDWHPNERVWEYFTPLFAEKYIK